MLVTEKNHMKAILISALPWLILATLSKLILRYATDLSQTLPLSHYIFNPTAGLNIAERARNGWEIPPLAWAAQSFFIFSISMFAVDLIRIMHGLKLIALWRYLVPVVISSIIMMGATASTLWFEKYSYENFQISANNTSYLSAYPDPDNIPHQLPKLPPDKKEIDVQRMEMRIWDNLYYYGPDLFSTATFLILLVVCKLCEKIILAEHGVQQDRKGPFKKLRKFMLLLVFLYIFDLFFGGVQSLIKDTAFILSNYGAAALWSLLYTIKWMAIITLFFWMRYEGPRDLAMQGSESP